MFYCVVLNRVPKWFVSLIDLEQHTVREKQAIRTLKNLLASHAFDYIVLRIKPGLTSCEDLATALELGYALKNLHMNVANAAVIMFFTPYRAIYVFHTLSCYIAIQHSRGISGTIWQIFLLWSSHAKFFKCICTYSYNYAINNYLTWFWIAD